MGTSDRRPYLSASALDQDLLDEAQDNLTGQLEMICEIDAVTGKLYFSDRAKYVDGIYYSPRVTFPDIVRTVGEWLAGEVEFPSLTIPINNADGELDNIMPGGADYEGWIGRNITVKVGLGEDGTTYTTVFSGPVTDVGGFQRNTTTFTLVARSDFDKLSVNIPNQVLIEDDFADIEDNFIGLGAPVIYGDWTVSLRAEAPEVPAFPVNGAKGTVLAGTEELRLVISSTPISVFDDTSVTLFRGDTYHTFSATDIAVVPATDNTVFDITQQNLLIDGSPWIYEPGDQFFVKVKGVDLGVGNLDNIVLQAKDILKRFGGLVDADFDANWATFAAKASPPESAISTFKSRAWVQETITALEQALQMLEQVRLEAFIDRASKVKLTSLHFDTFQPTPSFVMRNWDVVRGTFRPQIDSRNNWNQAKADFAFAPPIGQNKFSTPIFRNQAAIDQMGKTIGKLLVFPNLYIQADVLLNLKEMLKLASAQAEIIDVNLTPRAILKDIGDFAALNVQIGNIVFDGTQVGLIRELGYSPEGLAIIAKVWSFQMVNFPGYTGPNGTVGGFDATIIQET